MLEESSSLHVDSHGGEYDGEVVFVVIQNRLAGHLDQTSLSTDLRSNLHNTQLSADSNINLNDLIQVTKQINSISLSYIYYSIEKV